MKGCERLDAKVEAQVAERRLEARALLRGKRFEDLVTLDAGHGTAGSVGVRAGDVLIEIE